MRKVHKEKKRKGKNICSVSEMRTREKEAYRKEDLLGCRAEAIRLRNSLKIAIC